MKIEESPDDEDESQEIKDLIQPILPSMQTCEEKGVDGTNVEQTVSLEQSSFSDSDSTTELSAFHVVKGVHHDVSRQQSVDSSCALLRQSSRDSTR